MSSDLVFALAWETVEDLADRGWMRPPDRLILRMLGDDSWHRLIVAEPARNPLATIRRASSGRQLPLPPTRIAAGRTLISPAYFLGMPRAGSRVQVKLRYSMTARTLRDVIAAQGLESPILLSTDPILAARVSEWRGKVVYYARDDWAVHPSYKSLHKAIERAYERIRHRGVDVVAVSNTLLERVRTPGRSLRLPNGIEADEWRGTTVKPPWMASLTTPIAVYAGSVDRRLDVGWIGEIAAAGVTVIVAGPVTEPGAAAALAPISGVIVTGHMGRHDIVEVIRAADVCLIPHARSPLTEAMDPLKLYEYLAAGKPVLATDFPAIRGHGERVVLVEDDESRREALERVLSMGDTAPVARESFLASCDWDARYAQLKKFLLL